MNKMTSNKTIEMSLEEPKGLIYTMIKWLLVISNLITVCINYNRKFRFISIVCFLLCYFGLKKVNLWCLTTYIIFKSYLYLYEITSSPPYGEIHHYPLPWIFNIGDIVAACHIVLFILKENPSDDQMYL